MESSEKGITSHNLYTLCFIVICMGGVVYWSPNVFLWFSQKKIDTNHIDLKEIQKQLYQKIQTIPYLQSQSLPLIYTDQPKEMALNLIDMIKEDNYFDAYRVWLNPHDIELQIYFHEHLLQRFYIIRNTEKTKPFVTVSNSDLQFALIIEPYPNIPLSENILSMIHSTKAITFLLDPHSPYALQQAQTIGQSFQDIITNHQDSTDFFPLLPYSTISLSKHTQRKLRQDHTHPLLTGYQANRNDFLYLDTHLHKEERWNRCMEAQNTTNTCFLYLHESEIEPNILTWIQKTPASHFIFTIEILNRWK